MTLYISYQDFMSRAAAEQISPQVAHLAYTTIRSHAHMLDIGCRDGDGEGAASSGIEFSLGGLAEFVARPDLMTMFLGFRRTSRAHLDFIIELVMSRIEAGIWTMRLGPNDPPKSPAEDQSVDPDDDYHPRYPPY
jgi:hypothetical protein